MAAVLPVFDPGDDYTSTASAAITGGRLVEVTGNDTVAHAGAASTKVVGVAPNDAAINERVLVKRAGIWELPAAAAVVAGDILAAAANGQVSPIGAGTFGQKIGVALNGSAGAGATCRVALQLT